MMFGARTLAGDDRRLPNELTKIDKGDSYITTTEAKKKLAP